MRDPYFCAEDISNVGTCMANEVSLSGVTNVQVVDANTNQSITKCTDGQIIKIQSLDAKLNSNTGTRYDVTFWVGKLGNDPRDGGQSSTACSVLSLPDNTGSPFIGGFEGEVNDNCEDLEDPGTTPIDINFSGDGTLITCADSDNDQVADVQVLTTWWQNTNFLCGVGNPVLSPGSPAKCDFVTIPLGVEIVDATASLTIVKSSSGGTDTFSFSTTGFDAASPLDNGTGSFSLNTGSANPASVTDNNITISDLENGDTFSVAEDADPDWNLDSATCTNGDTPDSITLLPGDDVTCTFTNAVIPPASLTIVKSSSGGTDTFSFSTTGFDAASPLDNGTGSFSLNTGSNNPASVTDNNIVISDADNGDTFSVTEDVDPDWNLASATCTNSDTPDSITLLPGDDVTCTFTNVIIPTEGNSITIVKNTVGGNGTFSFDGGAGIGTFDLQTVGNTDLETFTDLASGIYTISETVPEGWDLATISCSPSANTTPDLENDEVEISLSGSDNITCTFTNVLIPVEGNSITIVKNTVGADGTFSFDGGEGIGTFDIETDNNAASETFTDLEPGGYTISENVPQGWDLNNIICSPSEITFPNPEADEVSIELGESDNVFCTFTNTQLGSISIFKTTSPSSSDVFAFTHDALVGETLPPSPFNVTAGDTLAQPQFIDLNPGTYTVTESGPMSDYQLDNIVCTDGDPEGTDSTTDVPGKTATINLDPGELVECTFVNNLLSSTVYIEATKQFTDGNTETPVTLNLHCASGTYAPDSITMTPDESGVVKHTFPVTSVPLSGIPECTVVEEPVPGYATEYRCPQEDADSTSDPSCVPVEDEVPENNFACKWTDVEGGHYNRCMIFNDPLPVEVEVIKVWEQHGTGGDYVKQKAEITIYCDAEIVNGFYQDGNWRLHETLKGWEGDFEDGVGVVAAWVIPEWYSEASGDSTVCWASEGDVDSAVEVESDCGDYQAPGMEVSVRTGGDSCTISNTLFFEGIPALSRYGLAIMALLMLGLGMFGFRRFV